MSEIDREMNNKNLRRAAKEQINDMILLESSDDSLSASLSHFAIAQILQFN